MITEEQAQIRAGLEAIARILGPVVEEQLEAFGPALRQLYDVVHQAYHDAGAPYADTHEGLFRWLGERIHAEHARRMAAFAQEYAALPDDICSGRPARGTAAA
jgi:hypothetical protein